MNHPQSIPEDEALLALRRTLWQLAVVGVGAAAAIERYAAGAGIPALWCVLVPLSALAVHFRQVLLDLLQSHRGARRAIVSRRRQPQQARRAGDGDRTTTRRPPWTRSLRIPSQVRPLAR